MRIDEHEVEICNAKIDDLPRLTEINNHYIVNTNATFDIEPQTIEQRRSWFKNYKPQGPYQLLVAKINGVVVGCAYSSRYRDHFSFDKTIETSIYLAHDCRSKGIGSLLYTELFKRLEKEKLHIAVVGIALPNEASIALHRKFGFEDVGIFKEYALKRNRFISSIWLQKRLGEGPA